MAAEATTNPPMLTEAIREKIRAYIPRYPSKRAVTLPLLRELLLPREAAPPLP